MTKNSSRYSHIKSFKDFETEKMHLYYQIRFAERKLELRSIELQMYLHPVKLAKTLFSSIIEPMFALIKQVIGNWFGKTDRTTNEEKESSGTPKVDEATD
jgi:hypothetical protein